MDRSQVRVNAWERKRKRFGEDLCDFVEPELISDGQSGHTLDDDPDPIAEDVHCFVEEISGGAAQVTVNGVVVIASHRIETPTSAAAIALTTHGKIRVHPRGDKGEQFFEQPVRTEQSFTPTVEFKAILVKEGYRQPGIT